MIRCEYVYGGEPEDLDASALPEYLKRQGGVLWVDMDGPSDDELGILETVFNFHPLAIDDVRKGGQRAKVADHDHYVFVVMHELQPDSGGDLDRPCIRHAAEIHAFCANSYIVTIRRDKSDSIDTTRKRWHATKELQHQGAFALLYLLLDTVVDDYFPALDAFDDRIDLLEQTVIQPAKQDVRKLEKEEGEKFDVLTALIGLRRNLLEARRYIAPLRDAIIVLLRRAEADGPGELTNGERSERAKVLFTYYQDVYDHTIRIVDTIDTYRDLLSGTLDAHLAVASNRLNEIVKVLTSVSIILMTWAGITGLYGMNFTYMPELHWKYGYVYFWGLIGVTGVIEWIYFRRRKWL